MLLSYNIDSLSYQISIEVTRLKYLFSFNPPGRLLFDNDY